MADEIDVYDTSYLLNSKESEFPRWKGFERDIYVTRGARKEFDAISKRVGGGSKARKGLRKIASRIEDVSTLGEIDYAGLFGSSYRELIAEAVIISYDVPSVVYGYSKPLTDEDAEGAIQTLGLMASGRKARLRTKDKAQREVLDAMIKKYDL